MKVYIKTLKNIYILLCIITINTINFLTHNVMSEHPQFIRRFENFLLPCYFVAMRHITHLWALAPYNVIWDYKFNLLTAITRFPSVWYFSGCNTLLQLPPLFKVNGFILIISSSLLPCHHNRVLCPHTYSYSYTYTKIIFIALVSCVHMRTQTYTDT